MSSDKLMNGLSFSKDEGKINALPSYSSRNLGGRWIANLTRHIQPHEASSLHHALHKELRDLTHRVLRLLKDNDCLPLSKNLSTIQITDISCFLNNPVTTESHRSSQALMWHSDYHGSSFLRPHSHYFLLITCGWARVYSIIHLHKPRKHADTRYRDDYINGYMASKTEEIQGLANVKNGDILIENTSGIHKIQRVS